MGLDHPLVQKEIGRWRSLPPEDVGIAVEGDVGETVLLSFWMVEASTGNGDRRVVYCRKTGWYMRQQRLPYIHQSSD